jgi:hypothetical protein
MLPEKLKAWMDIVYIDMCRYDIQEQKEVPVWCTRKYRPVLSTAYYVKRHRRESLLLATLFLNPVTRWRHNPKVYHRVHKSPPPVPIQSQLNPLHPPASLPKIHSDPILSSMPRSSEWSLYVGLSHQNPVHFSLLSHVCHMPRPPHSS